MTASCASSASRRSSCVRSTPTKRLSPSATRTKTLSLFFIDEVAKYRQYDDAGNELLGEYGKIFEEEYMDILNSKR